MFDLDKVVDDFARAGARLYLDCEGSVVCAPIDDDEGYVIAEVDELLDAYRMQRASIAYALHKRGTPAA